MKYGAMQYFPPRIITLSLLSPLLPNGWTNYRSLTQFQQIRTTTRRAVTPSCGVVDGIALTINTSPVIGAISPPPIDKKVSFRRNREVMAQKLLVEYDRLVFSGLLLQQQQPSASSALSSSAGSDNMELPSETVVIRWSNRLRTTAGRAHLILRSPATKKTKKLSRNEQVQQMELQQQQKQLDSVISMDHVTVKNSIHASQSLLVPNQLPQGARRTAIVELSTKVVDNEARLQTTLLHELCHVAAWMVDGNVKPPHGPCFKKWATIANNAIPTVPIQTKHNFEIQYKYSWECMNPSCSVTFIQRHSRRSVDIKRHVCGKCRGPLHENHTQQQSCSDSSTVATKNSIVPRPLTEYHRFIQKHTKIVTKQLMQQQKLKQQLKHPSIKASRMKTTGNVSPQKVMKECAKLWQQHKKKVVK